MKCVCVKTCTHKRESDPRARLWVKGEVAVFTDKEVIPPHFKPVEIPKASAKKSKGSDPLE